MFNMNLPGNLIFCYWLNIIESVSLQNGKMNPMPLHITSILLHSEAMCIITVQDKEYSTNLSREYSSAVLN